MRKALSIFLLFLGAFLLVAGLLAKFWAPAQIKKTPLTVDSVTLLSGEAQLFDGTALETVRVKASSVTHADSEKSDGDVVVFQSASCLMKDPDGNAPTCVSADDPQKRLVSAGTDHFATDRRTAAAVNESKYLPPDAKPHDGLVNKFPFDVEGRDYPFWDGLTAKSVPANFSGEEALDGVPTHKFVVSIVDADIMITEGVAGKYSTEKTMWIHSATGSILKQTEHQVRKLADSGQTILDLTFEFTPETVAKNVADAKSNATRLSLLTSTVPIVGFIGGLLALIAGFVLRVPEAPAPTQRSTRGRVAAGV